MNIEIVIKNVVWMENRVNIIIAEGKIVDIVEKIDFNLDNKKIFDANGLILLPSLIDAHVHLREPGYEYKEDIASGLHAAAGGGFGIVMAMANTNPINDRASVTEFMLDKAKESWPNGPRLYPIGALTKGLAGKEMAPLAELAEAGCKAFSNDGLPVMNNEIFRRCVEYAWDLGLKVIDHCEDSFLAKDGAINEGKLSSFLGLKGIPSVAESLQVARDILLSAYLDIPIHLAHISCKESVELIYWAKQKGIPITAETCPHYLFLTEDACNEYNTLAKVNPPLRTKQDQEALLHALREGVIDILVTDHAPHADFEKEQAFADAPNGISGLDTALSLSLKLLKKGFSFKDIIGLWGKRPAEIFGLEFSELMSGQEANFILVDLKEEWLVNPNTLFSKGKNTPWLGHKLRGRVKFHFYKGQLIFGEKLWPGF
ncbi:dihydroorotase [Desulfonauticus submarinus]|uniref:Dihydroorotase n=1 Tax=Desulfonauticus submarinus TaxID=206665 RepID=A0A1H0FAL7_9BACT|nr:dihydroorotase [Desulfonauticus submarinus]SDN91509.1 dihydroorotase [Desulfonauticus submarinus]